MSTKPMKAAELTKPRNGRIEQPIELPTMDIQVLEVELEGDSPLISHKWSTKARKQIEDKQAKKGKQARPVREPEEEFKECLYAVPGKAGVYGFPAGGFKLAAVDACSHVAGITKVEARGAFHVMGDIVPIDGKPTMRTDMVRVGMGSADIRYRAEFKEWSCKLTIRYNASVLSADQIVHLLNVAGFAIGVGDWRPQKDGNFGMWHCV